MDLDLSLTIHMCITHDLAISSATLIDKVVKILLEEEDGE